MNDILNNFQTSEELAERLTDIFLKKLSLNLVKKLDKKQIKTLQDKITNIKLDTTKFLQEFNEKFVNNQYPFEKFILKELEDFIKINFLGVLKKEVPEIDEIIKETFNELLNLLINNKTINK